MTVEGKQRGWCLVAVGNPVCHSESVQKDLRLACFRAGSHYCSPGCPQMSACQVRGLQADSNTPVYRKVFFCVGVCVYGVCMIVHVHTCVG